METQATKIQRTSLIHVGAVFMVLVLFLHAIDFVPESPQTHAEAAQLEATSSSEEQIEAVASDAPLREITKVAVQVQSTPTRITIEKIQVDAPILSPLSTDVDVLDRALLSGVVHYPGSGLLGEERNMLLFGHSSYLPVIHNEAFKAFNNLGKLEKGDLVHVYSESHVSVYRVETVELTEAEDAVIRFDEQQRKLTLATCNSFGKKSERYVVTATHVRTEETK